MNFRVRYSSIMSMLELCKKLKAGTIKKSEIENLMEHEDYQFEFSRYKGRVSKNEFVEYFMDLPNLREEDIKNKDLMIHHRYYKDLLDNLDFFIEKSNVLNKFTNDLFQEQIRVALKGLPENINMPDLSFVFTIGIGQSFGYAHENGMHFDFLQLIRNKSIDDFCATISHEVHHVGVDLIHQKLDFNLISIEDLFYVYFSGEGLAVKYCNNAQGILSKSIYKGPKNIGLDSFTWEYLNNDFYNTMNQFKNTISDIRNNKYKTTDEFEKHMAEYWMNPYIEGQSKNEIPKLLHFRLYSFGNEIWGIIHDCFGKDAVYETLENPGRFPEIFNRALEKLGHEEFKI